jgi:hypothetical protein
LRMAFATSFDQPQPSISFRALKARPILALGHRLGNQRG